MKILVITNDSLGARAWRARRSVPGGWRARSAVPVTTSLLFTTGTCDPLPSEFRVQRGWTDELKAAEAWCDVIVFQGFVIDGQPWLAQTDKVMVVDLYDPFHLEQLELSRETSEHDVRVEVVGVDRRRVERTDRARRLLPVRQ